MSLLEITAPFAKSRTSDRSLHPTNAVRNHRAIRTEIKTSNSTKTKRDVAYQDDLLGLLEIATATKTKYRASGTQLHQRNEV